LDGVVEDPAGASISGTEAGSFEIQRGAKGDQFDGVAILVYEPSLRE
jgi:hypothetical protein